jgi:hypothetical protein
MRLLIIDDSIFGEVLPTLLSQVAKIEIKIIQSSHKDALENFLLEDPDCVLICESWDEDESGKITEISKISLEDITNSAEEEVTIKTAGFDKKNDLVHLFKIEDVLASFNIQGG